MRFNNDDYLAAFPREERTPATNPIQDQPGSVTEEADNIKIKEAAPAQDLEPAPEDQGGDEDGNE